MNQKVKKAIEKSGINFHGKKWKYDPVRQEKIKNQKTTLFGKLSELTGTVIAPNIAETIAVTFNIGMAAVVKTEKQGRMLGDFTLFFMKGEQLQNQPLLETYADMTGMLLDRISQERETVREQSERKQAEAELRASEERFRSYIEYAPDGVFISDEKGKYVEVNPAACKITGYSEEELLKQSIPDLIYPEDIEIGLRHFMEVNEKGFARGEIRFITKDGEVRYWNVSAVKLSETRLLGFVQDITERKKAEESLQESEERFKKLSSFTFEGIIIHNNAIAIDVNQSTVEILGYERNEIIGMNLFSIIHPDSHALVKENLLKQVASPYQIIMIRKDGSTFDAEIEARDISYNGEYFRVACIRDITERKQIFERINSMSEMLDVAPNSISIHDTKGNFHYANQKTYEIHGYGKNEFLQINLHELDVPESEALLSERLELIEKQGYATFEVQHYRKDKTIFPLEVFAKKVIWQGQEAILSIATDITERIENLQKLNESEEKFREMAELLPQIVFESDMQGKLTYVNKQAYKLTGYSEQDGLIGKSTLSFYIPEDRERAAENIKLSLTGKKQALSNGYTMTRKDGSTFNVLVYSNPIIKGNEPAGLRGIIVDISEIKQAQKELIEAKEKAEESDRLKSAFLANMSHEIRTPMNGILGFAELLKEPGLTGEEQQRYIGIIEKGGERMLNIINDIIDISKIEAGLMKIDLTETNINEQTEYLYTFFKPEVEGKKMKLRLNNSLPSKEVTITTDREKLYAVLSNLIKNAIKYSEAGEIEFGYEKKSDVLEFYVKDTGIGIPTDRQQAIFERFIQADIADKMARQGAGLGLSISTAYVEMLGGEMWVESKEGRGSTFYFTLPFKSKTKDRTETQEKQSTEVKYDDSPKLKIIIAEDDVDSLFLLELRLKKFSREIIKAYTGVEAVEKTRNNPDTDMILMDIRMPEMSGYEAVRQIRTFNKKVIIIAQTAYGLTGDREKAINAGCDEYLSKPIRIEELMKLINKYIHN